MRREVVGHRVPSAAPGVVLCLQGEEITWPQGGRDSAPAGLS